MKSAVAPATTILNIGDLLEVVAPGTHKQNDRTLEGCVDLGQRGLRMGSADGRDVTHQVMLMIERLARTVWPLLCQRRHQPSLTS